VADRTRTVKGLVSFSKDLQITNKIIEKSAPIQLAQCRSLGLVVSSAKILMYFANKNIRKQSYQTPLGNDAAV